jgi:ATP-dependent DNA helicase RecG
MTTEIVEGTPVVAAYMPEFQPSEKPIYIESEGLEAGVYRRIGSSDQGGTDADLQELYEERSGGTYDASIVSGAELDDIDFDAVADYRKTRAQVDPDAEELNWDNADLLRALRCVRKHRGDLTPTVAGMLLFGSKMALRRLFPAMRIDYTRVPGREWMEDPDRRYLNSIEVRNPGYSLVDPDDLGAPTSKTRNLTIASVLHDTRFAETKGTGIEVMRVATTVGTHPGLDSWETEGISDHPHYSDG